MLNLRNLILASGFLIGACVSVHSTSATSAAKEDKQSKLQATTGSFLFQKDMPVWLSLTLAVGAGVGTYFLAPRINKKIELEKSRSSHVVTAINRVNDDVVKLVRSIRRLLAGFIDNPTGVEILRGECLDYIAEAQWRLIDLKVILLTDEDRRLIDKIGQHLDHLKVEVASISLEKSQDDVLMLLGDMTKTMKVILGRLYKVAGLNR